MARRCLKTRLDLQMEDPEQRKFAPGFLEHVHAQRPALLSDALTVWRWGRQTRLLKSGKTLGSYELWGEWCRDPLLTLGMRDPVERQAEIKAADPRRRLAIEFFDIWWRAHGDALVRASEVETEVFLHIDDKATRKPDGEWQWSRQRVARFLNTHVGTRLGGYAFDQIKDATRTRATAQYQLKRTEQKGEQ